MTGLSFEQPSGGFVFDNCRRNELLLSNGALPSKVQKTGTTIAAVTFKDGVVIGADSRCTEGNIIFDDNIDKFELLQLLEKFNNIFSGYIGAYLIIVGVDVTGSHIAAVHPHGSISYLPFIASGSGGYTSLSVIEDRFKKNLNVSFYFILKEDEAKQLVRDALYASTTTDLYLVSKINMFVLTKEKLDKFLPYEVVGIRDDKQADYILAKETTQILSTNVKKIEFDIINEKVKTTSGTHEAMELA